MKKQISTVLLAVMTLLICSCGGAPVELLSFIDENADNTVNCDGKTFNFASPGTEEWYWGPDSVGVPTLVMDKQMARYKEAEEKFNLELSVDSIDHSNMVNLFATGDDVPELIYASSCYAYDIYKMGILVPLSEISTIDINDSKWGDHDYIQFGKYDGDFYGFIPWNWQFVPQYCGAVMFNGEMIQEYGGIDPYEMQENGLWNWENWESELRRYAGIDENGVQRYGALLSTRFAARGAIFSNGGSIIELNDDGSYEYALKSSEAIEALEFLARLNKEGLVNDDDLVKDCDLSPFSIDKLAPFFIGESFYCSSFSEAQEVFKTYASSTLNYFGYMPFPTGPNGDSETDVGGYMYRNGLLLYVTNLADIEVDNIGAVIDFIFEPLDDSPAEAWKEYLDSTIFSETNHEKCLNNFVNVIDRIEYDYSAQMSDGAYDSIDRALEAIVAGTKSAVEGVSSIESIVMSDLD